MRGHGTAAQRQVAPQARHDQAQEAHTGPPGGRVGPCAGAGVGVAQVVGARVLAVLAAVVEGAFDDAHAR